MYVCVYCRVDEWMNEWGRGGCAADPLERFCRVTAVDLGEEERGAFVCAREAWILHCMVYVYGICMVYVWYAYGMRMCNHSGFYISGSWSRS